MCLFFYLGWRFSYLTSLKYFFIPLFIFTIYLKAQQMIIGYRKSDYSKPRQILYREILIILIIIAAIEISYRILN